MAIDPQSLNEEGIVDYTTKILKKFEGFREFIYDDGTGIPTIGYGVALVILDNGTYRRRTNPELADIFNSVEQSPSPNDLLKLEAAADFLNKINGSTNPFKIVAEDNQVPELNVTDPKWTISTTDGARMIKNVLGSDPDSTLSTINELRVRLGRDSADNYIWDKYQNSREGAVILSLYYNLPGLIGDGLRTALKNEDREVAWFEIRYNSNKAAREKINSGIESDIDEGIAKRRYLESEIFGLYNPGTVDQEEAEDVYKMIMSNKDYIFKYENEYKAQVPLAITDFINSGENIIVSTVSTLEESLEAAAVKLKSIYVGEANNPFNIVIPLSAISALDIQIAQDDKPDLTGNKRGDGNDRYKLNGDNGNEQNDLLIGNDNHNILTGNGGIDVLIGLGGFDALSGGDGNDYLVGGTEVDSIDGGIGNDVLVGGNADGTDDNVSDTLRGGNGYDTYYVGLNDVIIDSGGGGIIYKADNPENPIPGGNFSQIVSGTGIYTSSDNLYRFKLSPDGTLQILGSYITVQGFTNGDFGINLDPEATSPTLTLVNGTSGNDLINPLNPLDTTAAVNGTSSNEELHGLGGDDDVFGRGGDDVLFGEDGDDQLISEDGHDVLIGGAGSDFLTSVAGKDVLQGDDGVDLLDAGMDDDFLEGGAGNDGLFGGGGSDSLFGGDGDDFLRGDGLISVAGRNWSLSVSVYNVVTAGITYTSDSLTDKADLLHGGEGNDVLFGDGGNDQLYGDDGDDWLFAGDGNDRLEGGLGADLLQGGLGDDVLEGGDGDDHLQGEVLNSTAIGGNDTINGGAGNDVVFGGAGNDVIAVGIGDDQVDAGLGDDIVITGEGADEVLGGAGNDTIFGNDGSDEIEGGDGDDKIEGNAGNDELSGGKDSDVISGGEGQDLLFGDEGNDVLTGDAGNDQLYGGAGYDVLMGGEGNDQLFGGNNDDELHGGTGVDLLQGGAGEDLLFGNEENDSLKGEQGNDTLFGGAGDDELQGNEGNDILNGEAGNDRLFGQAGDDELDGGDGADDLRSGIGNDTLLGGAGNDSLQGGDGDDFLSGGTGADTMVGGVGNDTYQFNRGNGNDVILDDGGVLDTLSLGPDIATGDISISTAGNDLIIRLLDNGLLTTDQITLVDWLIADNRIERFTFNGGAVWNVTDIQALLPDQIALVDGLTANGSSLVTIYTFTPGASNPDGFDITIDDAGGKDVLKFQQAVVNISGTNYYATPSLTGSVRVGNDLVLTVAISSNIGTIPNGSGQVTITDFYTSGGHLESISFPSGSLNVPNPVPVRNDTAEDQTIALNAAYSYQLAAGTFTDTVFDTLSITTSTLPAWLSFDASTLTFSGTPTTGDEEYLTIAVTATDTAGQAVSVDFKLNVGNVNIAPTLADAIDDQVARAQDPFSFAVPANAFADVNPDAELTYTATLSNGDALPAWLSFDAETLTFSGTPDDLDVGTVNVRVTATDNGDLSVSDVFRLTINEFNATPVAKPDTAAIVIEPTGPVNTSEFVVNSVTAGAQDLPSAASLEGGGYVVVWRSVYEGTVNMDAIVGQRYTQSGNPVGGEFVVSQDTSVYTDFVEVRNPKVVGLAGGGFAVFWRDSFNNGGGDTEGIMGQLYDADGEQINSEFVIDTADDFRSYDVTALPSGGFVIAWSPEFGAFDRYYVAQRYDSVGGLAGSQVPALGTGSSQISIAAFENDGFVIVSAHVGQRFDSNGTPVGDPIVLYDEEGPQGAKVVTFTDNSFIIISRKEDPLDDYQEKTIVGDRFDSNGDFVETILISDINPSFQYVHEVTAMSDGSFVVTWNAVVETPDGQERAILGARFDSFGQVTTFEISEIIDDARNSKPIELSDGSLVVVWQQNLGGPGSKSDIFGRHYPSGASSPFLIDVLANDIDVDDDTSSFILTDVSILEGGGTVTIVNNKVKFSPGTDFNDLVAGKTQQVVIEYVMSDDGGEISSSTLTLTVRGSEIVIASTTESLPYIANGSNFDTTAGDFNGDGLDDVLHSVGPNAYIIYGREDVISGAVDPMAMTEAEGVHLLVDADIDFNTITSAGDVNGDGYDDVMITDSNYSSSSSSGVGAAYIVFGGESVTNNLDLRLLDGTNGFRIIGMYPIGNHGEIADGGGDINGDGYADLVFGVQTANEGRGEVYVFFGHPGTYSAEFSIDALNGNNGFRIPGNILDQTLGNEVSIIGDINGDGLDDFSVHTNSSEVDPVIYVIFGNHSFSEVFDISTLDGTNGFTLTGSSEASLDRAGDINGDGIEDFISGHVVIFGKDNGFDSTLNVDDLPVGAGFVVTSAEPGDEFNGIGDINADGFDDLGLGNTLAVTGLDGAGATYIIFGSDTAFPETFDVTTVDGNTGLIITGTIEDEDSGSWVSNAGDLNGDGFADFLIGAPGNNRSHIIYGSDLLNSIEALGSDGADIVDVVANDQAVFTLSGDDIININDVVNVVVNSGAGDDEINIIGGTNHVINPGTGINKINIRSTFASLSTTNTSSGSTNRTSITTVEDNRYIHVLPGFNGGDTQIFDIFTKKVVSAESVRVRRGSLVVDIDGIVELHFEGVNTDNLLDGPLPFANININNVLTFTYASLLEQGFDIDGTEDDDAQLIGTEVTDRINGFAGADVISAGKGDDTIDAGLGNDVIDAGAGDDLISGGGGDDVLQGGAGDDTYTFATGDGSDEITDLDGLDQIVFDGGLSTADISVEQSGNDLVIHILDNSELTSDNLTLREWFTAPENRIERFIFGGENLSVLSPEDIELMIEGAQNHAPVLGADTSIDVIENTTLVGNFAATDEDLPADTLSYTLGGADASLFEIDNTGTLSFISAPDYEVVNGTYTVTITANDGTENSNTQEVTVEVTNANESPFVNEAVIDQSVIENTQFSFTLPTLTFADPDAADVLTLVALSAGGGALPDWLSFNATTGTFAGTPDSTDLGQHEIQVTATDGLGLSITDSFTITVTPPNSINGTPGADQLTGTSGVDIIRGFDGNDYLSGLGGNDTLIGGAGLDIMLGGDGNDTFIIEGSDSSFDVIDGGAGTDTLLGSVGDDVFRLSYLQTPVPGQISGHIEIIDGGTGHNIIAGTTNNDTLDLSGITVLNIHAIDGGAGNDTITGTSGNDLIIGGSGIDTLNGGDGDDIFQITGTDGNLDNINGGQGYNIIKGSAAGETLNFSAAQLQNIDAIDGDAGNDTITGTAGDDLIIGGAGRDTLNGGDGNDTFLITGSDSEYDVVNGGAGVDAVLGGSGDDVIRFFSINSSNIEQIDGGTGNNILAGTSSGNVLDLSGIQVSNIQTIDGGTGNDTITGSSGNDFIIGGSGNDTLNGGDGDDTFQIGAGHGTDIIDGGAGNNIIIGTSSGETLNFSSNQISNIDLIDGGGGNDTITGTSGNDIIVGGAGRDTMTGGDGDDTFLIYGNDSEYDVVTGGLGADTILGGNGDDVFRFFNTTTGAVSVEVFNGGLGNNAIEGTSSSDTLNLTGSQILNIATISTGNGHDTINLSGIQSLSVTTILGGSHDDTINLSGATSPNIITIDGDTGNDVITGSTGNDVIIGGTGRDTLNGGDGDDTFQITGVDGDYDIINGGLGTDTVLGGSGDDVFRFYNTTTGAVSVEVFNGGLGNNAIEGTSSSDTLNLTGSQILNIATISTGNGHDTINLSGIQALSVTTILGGSHDDTINLSGATSPNIITIDGDTGNDVITGSTGNDVIIGGAGGDTLNGGDGDDTFQITGNDTNYDIINGGLGTDTVLGGSGDDVFRFYNTTTGAVSVEVFNGGLGNNAIEGTSSSDTLNLTGSQILNIATISTGNGHDTINLSSIQALSVTTILGGSHDDTINLSGATSPNIITIDGGTGNDVITGSTGNDVIIGGTGGDTLNGGAGSDTYLYTTGYGLDLINETSGTDEIEFNGVNHNNLWFWQNGNDLRMGIIGTTDWLTIDDWYVSNDKKVESFSALGDNYLLLENQISALVSAMAIFNVQGAGHLNVSQQDRDSVESVIAAAWTAA